MVVPSSLTDASRDLKIMTQSRALLMQAILCALPGLAGSPRDESVPMADTIACVTGAP
ncbi:MAG TPA: hypothetical protein VKH14_00560 [Candidatus Udaeobacter sp.]|nr:hypothetical protein [Candidatus Udaeobacter sp.]